MNLKRRFGIIIAVAIVAVVGTRLIAEPNTDKPKTDKPKAEDKPKKAESYTPVLSIEETMEGQGTLMKHIKGAIIDGAWADGSKSALILAELANTNQFHKDADDYRAWARELSGDCLELAKALKHRDANESKRLIAKAKDVCSDCHHKYKKKKKW